MPHIVKRSASLPLTGLLTLANGNDADECDDAPDGQHGTKSPKEQPAQNAHPEIPGEQDSLLT
jgi:hypothetical protein